MRTKLIAILIVQLWLGTTRPLWAQSYIAPYLGFNWGGNSGCPTAQNCEDRTLNLGVGLGTMHGVVGFEEDLGYARDFFGLRPDGGSSVLVLMSNMLIEIPIGMVRPYGLGGVGLLRSHIDASAVSLLVGGSDNSFAYNLGGGLVVRLTPHVAARGDWRYFHTFDDLAIAGFSANGSSLRFWRGTFGVIFSF